MQRKGFFSRLVDLWRGFWGVKLSDAEARNAEGVYHNAIADHVKHHDRLKAAIARLVYLRNRLEADFKESSEDLELIAKALLKAAQENNDEQALALIRKKRSLEEEVARLETELARLSEQTDKAKTGLVEVMTAIKRLKEERTEMLARKAHALARRDAQVALKRLSDTSHLLGSMTALENVRESIVRLEQEVDLEEETPSLDGEVSMTRLRRDAQAQADREALLELKAELGSHLLVEAGAETELGGGNGKTLGPIEAEAQVDARVDGQVGQVEVQTEGQEQAQTAAST